jgi:DNA-binding SARP family transcriptional activator
VSGLRFELLGQPRVLRAGIELDIGPGKQRAVLAVLLLHANRPVPTTMIIDAVWPDDPPANGPNVVQKHVAGLRKILEPERIPRAPGRLLTRTDAGYQLTVDLEAFDVAEFHAHVDRAHAEPDAAAVNTLRAAIALWHGVALAGLDGTVFDVERTRLDEARANAVEERIDRELRLGLHVQVVPELVALTAQHPYRERLRGQLMLALYRSGRQADALAAFRDGRRLLNEELGIEPGDALRSLHEEILAAARTSPPHPTEAPPPSPTRPRHPRRPNRARPTKARRSSLSGRRRTNRPHLNRRRRPRLQTAAGPAGPISPAGGWWPVHC